MPCNQSDTPGGQQQPYAEDNSNQRSGTMSMLPRIGTLQSANRVLMLNGPIPNTIGELLTILDFVKQSPEGMLALVGLYKLSPVDPVNNVVTKTARRSLKNNCNKQPKAS
jgi:hypothetical protein